MMIPNSVRYLKGVGETRAKLLKRLKIENIEDLLNHFPRAYEDRSKIYDICELHDGESACVRASVSSTPQLRRAKGGLQFLRFNISDDTGSVTVTFFNAKYLKVTEGETYRFYGKAEVSGRFISMTNPVIEPDGENMKTGRILPVYSLTENLNNSMMIKMISQALDEFADKIPETLPETVRERYGLIGVREAYLWIHAPVGVDELTQARRRLAFEELFCLSIGLSLIKTESGEAGERMTLPDMDLLYRTIPFELTGAQKRCINEALADMTKEKNIAMRRMVQGDVGSGKTMVAAVLIYAAAKNGMQSAMMVPTEILAHQHFEDMSRLFSSLGIRVGILTSGMSAADRKITREALMSGDIDFVVGTHALLSEGVGFSKLRLVITDEQHRFGVRQRSRLSEKADAPPHILVMSATPIPRSLAMVLYGDMDLSIVDELPPGRIPVDTRAPTEDYRNAVYEFMLRQLKKGRQAYVVCPSIEESEDDDLKAASMLVLELHEEYFKDFRVELLHGKMAGHLKDEIMSAMSRGEINVLVSTTVIEVGVNIPNANMIVIENAERFGLSQLHQLRGRVGRSDMKSYCVLLSRSNSPGTRERLEVMCRTNDGFDIAREDLRLRGPGEFFGERQSGVPGLRIAELGTDMKMLSESYKTAEEVLADDPQIKKAENSALREKVYKLFETERT